MPLPSTADQLRRRRLIVTGIAVTLLLIAVAYAVLVHRIPSSSTPPAATGNEEARTAAADPSPTGTVPVVADLPALRSTSDPDVFAGRVAEAIFAWDTTTLLTRADHLDRLIDVADPSGASTPGLVADLDGYLPTQQTWAGLAAYRTRQWLAIETVTTPTTWALAEAQAGGQLLPGTTARTIHGTRHRAGIWDGTPVASEHAVGFTVFVVCGPSYPRCHLLRVSMLDKPLE